MGLSVGNSRLGHGGLGLLNALNDVPATNPVQFLLTEAGDFLITEDGDFLIYG